MARDLSDLLRETAEQPDLPVDVPALRGRARRRRLLRRAASTTVGIAAVSALALIAAALGRPEGEVELIDDPPILEPPAPEEPGEADDAETPEADGDALGPLLDLRPGGLPQEGVAVTVGDRVVLLRLDGSDPVLGHLRGTLEPAPPTDGGPTKGLLPFMEEGGTWLWSDPALGAQWGGLGGTPLAGPYRVMYDVDQHPDERWRLLQRGEGVPWALDDALLAAWPEDAPWHLTPDHRVVSWASCSDGDCPYGYFDTQTGESGELEAGCWVAAAGNGGSQVHVCEHGGQLRVLGPDGERAVDVPAGHDGEPASATAVFGDGLVRVDNASCDISEPFLLRGGGLVALLGEDRVSNPSAVPLGVTEDGRHVVHLNEADCDGQAEVPGIYVGDADGDLSLVWAVEARPGAARMWSSAPALIDDPSQPIDDAQRDGVVAELAELPLHLRARPMGMSRPADVDAPEGRWMIARPSLEILPLTEGCGLGDPDGLYGRDIVCVFEYGEVLLLDQSGTRVERAYPLPQVPPQWIVLADDAVYCGRQGDGGLPTSMLCRIDRATGELTVRLFTHDRSDGSITDYLGEFIAAAGWAVNDSHPGTRFSEAELTDDGLVISGHDGSALVDPDTLEVAPQP